MAKNHNASQYFFRRITTSLLLLPAMAVSSLLSILPLSVSAQDNGLTIQTSRITYKTAETFTAVFSYSNNSGKQINIAAGANNYLSPGEKNERGQTQQFKKGVVENAWSIDLSCETSVTWVVMYNGQELKAEANAPRCGSVISENGSKQSASTCYNPKGWIEAVEYRTESTNFYWVPNKNTSIASTPTSSPDDFTLTSCTSTAPMNYLKDGKMVSIENQLIQTQNPQYPYSNKANNFSVLFASDPNNGWQYFSKETNLIANSLKIGGKPIVWSNKQPVIKNNTITYFEILPSVDLVYTVTNSGVSKQFILQNEQALQNDLSTIEYTLIETSGKTIKKENQLVEKLPKVNKAKKNATKEEKLQTAEDSLKNWNVSQVNADLRQQAEEYISLKQTRINDLKTKSLSPQEVDKQLEIIENSPQQQDTLKLTTSNVTLGTPRSYSLNKVTTQETPAGFSFKDNILKIFNGTSLLNDKSLFPYVIDPDLYLYSPGEDSFVRMNAPISPQCVHNPKFLAVGGNFYDGTTGVTIGRSRAYIKFTGVSRPGLTSTNVSSTQVVLYQYAHSNANSTGIGFNFNRINGTFSESNLVWNGSPSWYGGTGNNVWSYWNNFANTNSTSGVKEMIITGFGDFVKTNLPQEEVKLSW